MKVPTTATCGRDPPDRQLQSNTPRAAAWHLCESLKWGDVYLLLPKPGSTPGCSLAPSEMLLVSVQRAVPLPHFAKGASWEHNSKGRMTGEEETDLYCPTLCFLGTEVLGTAPSWPVLSLPLAGGAKCVAAKIRIANNCYWAGCILTWDRRQLEKGKRELFCYFPQQNSRFC